MTDIKKLFEEARAMWTETFVPHYPKQHAYVFVDEMNDAEAAFHNQKYAEAINPVAKWHGWTLAKTYHADVSGPALAFFDMEELLKKLKQALLDASKHDTLKD